MIWYSHLSQNVPQFIVIHTVKGFSIVNKAEIDVFLVVWYSHLIQNFPQFVVIYTVKGFSIVNKAEADVILVLSFF